MKKRAVISFLALPGTVAFIVPLWIGMSSAPRPAFNPVCLSVLRDVPALMVRPRLSRRRSRYARAVVAAESPGDHWPLPILAQSNLRVIFHEEPWLEREFREE